MKPHDKPPLNRLAFAEHLRQNQTVFERKLWRSLQKDIAGSQVWRQTVVQGYIVDFYIPDFQVAIELDGKQHDPQKDSNRDKQLFRCGVTVLRFKNPTTSAHVNDILSVVYSELRHRKRLPDPKIPTNPQDLSEQGRGFLNTFKGKEEEKPKKDKHSGNVENPAKTLTTNEVFGGKIVEIQGKPFKRGSCTLQQFSSRIVAENEARRRGTNVILKCPQCGRIHVDEKP